MRNISKHNKYLKNILQMKILLLSAFMVLMPYIIRCQPTFEQTLSDPLDQMVVGIIEVDGAYIVNEIIGERSKYNYHSRLHKMDSDGLITYSKLLKDSIYSFTMEHIIPIENNQYLGFGSQSSGLGNNDFFTAIVMDADFNILTEKTVHTDFVTIGWINYIREDGVYLVVGSGYNVKTNFFEIFAFKFNDDLDTIASTTYFGGTSSIVFDLLPHFNTDNINLFVRGFSPQTNTASQILTIDSAMNIVDVIGMPGDIGVNNDAHYLNEQYYILTGVKHIYSSPDKQLAIMLVDTSNTLGEIRLLGPTDTVDYPGNYSNLDFISAENIYYGGTANFSIGGIFASNDSWFILNKLDSALELEWQRFYGGDAYYTMWSLMATQDGGCLMGGTRYDYQNQIEERDGYIVKVNADGLIVGMEEEQSGIIVQDAIVYPNPGSLKMIIQSGPQISGAAFYLFDLNGTRVLSTILETNIETIDTASLAQGSYIYKIIHKNKIIGEGKWIKQ